MRLTRALAFLLVTIGAIGRVFAADGPTTISGVAVDAQGLALPGVTVTLRAAGGQTDPQEQITDAEGRFAFEALMPGTYSIVLSLSGFEEKGYDAIAVPATSELRAVMQIAGVTETVVVKPDLPTSSISSALAGEAVIEQQVLSNVPLASERFEDALPLLPGVVRGPDGLLNMNGARADQSALLLNGLNMTDPVTGHFSARLPIEAIDSMNVHAGVYSAAFGNATGGVTDIVVRRGQDTVDFQIQNIVPRLRFNDGIEGFNAFTPRVRIAGPIQPGRMWFSQAMSYRFVRTQVEELSPRGNDEQKVKSFDSVTQIDRTINPRNHVSATLVLFPSNIDNAGIDTLHPFDASPDLEQRAWTVAVTERAILSDSRTLSLTFATKQYDMNVLPKHDAASLVTVSGTRNNYFNHFDRNSQRYDASGTLAIAVPNAWGQHLFRTGGQWARTSYDGVDLSHPVIVTRADGSALRRIDFIGSGAVGASNIEMAGFLEDEWAVLPTLTLHGGARYGYEQIGGEQTIAPRVDASYRLFPNGGTVVKAGYGQFYDKLPLNAADFSSQQTRVVTEYDASGAAAGTKLLPNVVSGDGLRTPKTNQWNVELDQRLAPGLLARVGYRQARGSNQLIVDPTGDTMQLSSDGRSRSNEIETTIRRQFGNSSHITASYVHASAKGDLNDFVSLYGDMRDPIIRPDEYTRQSFDVPNRFLVWSVLNLPKDIVVSPTLEYRIGFPYSVIDEQQKTVGIRNEGGRYPNLFTLDLAATKIVKLTKTRRARVGMQVFNLTNHFNPQDVQNNTSSPTYGQYANSVDRQIRTKFTLLF
jgi:hypothetical protein